jgi:hypothetical protein
MNITDIDIKYLKKIIGYKENDEKVTFQDILHKLIFPIKIPEKLIGTKDIILDFKNTEKLKNNNFQIPNALFINKICSNDTKDELIKLLNNYFKKNIGNNFFRRKNLFESKKNFGFIGLKEIFRKDNKIYEILKNMITNLFLNLYKDYEEDFVLNNIIPESKITMLYYSHNEKNTFEGLAHHIDSFGEIRGGAISVISFDDSVLDYIPFVELKKEDAFRVLIPKNFALTFDGNLRYYYTHGVPKNIKYTNNFRYAINIRHPIINIDGKDVKNSFNCDLYDSFDSNINIFTCYSSISTKPLKFTKINE